MYSYKQRKKAVELYIKHGLVAAPVIRILGYPNRRTLQNWYREYMCKGRLKKKFADGKSHPTSPYSDEQMKKAVDTYVRSGKNLNLTISKLGYPKSPKTLSLWISIFRPTEKRICKTGHESVEYSQEVKEEAVLDFISGESRPEEVAERHGVNRSTLYFWKNQLLGEDYEVSKNQYTQEDVDSSILL